MDELRQRITDRLTVLLREADLGEERLCALENEVLVLRQTLLRIGGAVQVLREILGEADTDDAVRMEPAGSATG